ncbi:hypothetical protein [Streptomyces aureocirculatus]|uniref:hypothetical protein n=1 Tax=Streptomyces aureocirculatus TaxID=67275 RepID=UPI0004C5CED2|nr:hypothetical protein [Streptomyces aureocirculatus]
MPPTDSTAPFLDLNLWGTGPLDPAELARLAAHAGHYLALHTLRPTPTPHPPHNPPFQSIATDDGWIQRAGWRKIQPHPSRPAPGALAPSAVSRRLTRPAEIRKLLRKTMRDLRIDPLFDTVPDGVALALTDDRPVPDSYWAYLAQEWAQSITGAPDSILRLPPFHDSTTRAYRHARIWLHREIAEGADELTPVAEALTTPGGPADLMDVRVLLAYDRPAHAQSRTERIMLARLVTLYWTALDLHHHDTPLLDLLSDRLGRRNPLPG